jgi:hypothetical protein
MEMDSLMFFTLWSLHRTSLLRSYPLAFLPLCIDGLMDGLRDCVRWKHPQTKQISIIDRGVEVGLDDGRRLCAGTDICSSGRDGQRQQQHPLLGRCP